MDARAPPSLPSPPLTRLLPASMLPHLHLRSELQHPRQQAREQQAQAQVQQQAQQQQ